MIFPIKRTAQSRLETYASVSRTQTDEETYDHSNPDVAAVPDRSTADRHRIGGACDRAVVPVDVGDREVDDMELTLLERWDRDDWTMTTTHDEILRALAIAQAVEEWKVSIEEAETKLWLMRRADELLRGDKP